MSSSNSPCAACKCLRRKCTQECVFAPYFPPDNPQRFSFVHRVFGASNVAKLLNELNAAQRDDAVKSLAYEAEARLRDPVYGCVGLISVLQHRLRQIQIELNNAKKELATYIGPQAFHQANMPPAGILAPSSGIIPQQQQQPYSSSGGNYPYNGMPPPAPMTNIPTGGGGGQLVIRDPSQQQQHHQILDAQQLAVAAVAVREQQDMFRGYEQQQQQNQEFLRFNGGGGYDLGSVSGSGFNSHISSNAAVSAEMSPSLALGGGGGGSFDGGYGGPMQQPSEAEHHQQLQAQLMVSPQQQQQQQPSESEEGRNGICLSC